MARIDQYPNVDTLNEDDEFVLWQAGAVKNITTANLRAALGVGTGWAGEVDNYAALPAAAEHLGETYMVKAASGVWLINRKSAGFYLSNGTAWVYIGDYPTTAAEVGADAAGTADNAVTAHTSGVQHGTTAQEQTDIATALAHAESIGNPHGLALADVVSIILTACPRHTWIVYGDSSDGGTTPDGTTQTSIDALINAGVPEANILWNYREVGVSNVFEVQNLSSASALDAVTLTLAGGTLVVQDLSSASSLDNVTLTEQGGAGGTLTVQDLTSASSLDNVTLVLAGGTLVVADLSSASALDNVTLTEQGGGSVTFTETFDGSGDLSANWGFDADADDKIVRSSGVATGANLGFNMRFASVVSSISTTNHYAQAYCTMGGPDESENGAASPDGVMVRTGGTIPNRTLVNGYLLTQHVDAGDTDWFAHIYKITNGVPVIPALGSWSVPETNRWIKLTASGSTLTAYYSANGTDWTQLGTATDSTYSTGAPGIAVRNNTTSVDNFEGGDL